MTTRSKNQKFSTTWFINAPKVEIMPTQTINEVAYGKREEFYLFGCVMEATMIDKKLGDKTLQIEISCGNAGNSIDGQLMSAAKASGNDTDSVASVEEGNSVQISKFKMKLF